VTSRFARDPTASIGPDDDLLREGVLDSIAIMEIVGFVETAFGVQIEGDVVTVDNFQSLGSMTRLSGLERFGHASLRSTWTRWDIPDLFEKRWHWAEGGHLGAKRT
jgi:acyl carrier protein